MAPHKHALIPLALGAIAAIAFFAYRTGATPSSAEFVSIALLCSPIAVACLAAYVGREKRAGRGAVAFAWLFLLGEAALLWTVAADKMASTAGIGIAIVIAAQLLLALLVLIIAAIQKKTHAATVT